MRQRNQAERDFILLLDVHLVASESVGRDIAYGIA